MPGFPLTPEEWTAQCRAFQQIQQELAAIKSAARSNKKSKKGDKNTEMTTVIRITTRTHVFKSFKFLTDDDGETRLAEAVMAKLPLKGFVGSGDAVAIQRQNFLASYAEVCTKVLNEQRNYTMSGIKEVCFKYMDKHDKAELPRIQDIMACIKRTLPLRLKKNLEVALWWVDYLMPKFTGNGKEFSTRIRYYETISTAKTNDTFDLPDMTVESEAFGYLVYENNYKRWPCQWQLEKDHPDKEAKTQVLSKRKKDFEPKDGYKYFFVEEHKDLGTPYTNPDAGQQQFGGWLLEGLERYMKLVKHIRRARASPEGQAWEAKLLEELRKSRNITGRTHKEQLRIRGKKSPNQAKIPCTISASDLFGDNDDDDEELEELEAKFV